MEQDVYFIHGIFYPHNYKKVRNEITIVLFKVTDEIENESNFIIKNISFNELIEKGIVESSFVILDNEKIIKANDHFLAKRQIFFNNIYRGKLIKQYKNTDGFKGYEENEIKNVKSYHVNVGHGNCSFIAFNMNDICNIWMVDCSEYDFTNHKSYLNNINSCLDHIKKEYNLQNMVINKLLITHPHYDHISGIDRFINNNLFNETEVWTNFYYSWPESKYNKLLLKMLTCNSKISCFIEPKVSNGTKQIEILYPENTILRVKPAYKYLKNYDLVPKNKLNNASVIYKIKLGKKSMVFPGDIETAGWNNLKNCNGKIRSADYYCISHHGSINGHLRNKCSCKNNKIKSIFCCRHDKPINILMGRDGAFSGMFSKDVLKDFAGNIYRTDSNNGTPLRFIELDWLTGIVKYH